MLNNDTVLVTGGTGSLRYLRCDDAGQAKNPRFSAASNAGKMTHTA